MAEVLEVAKQVLQDVAPELSHHVSAFLYGGSVGSLPLDEDWSRPSVRLRLLHDKLQEACTARRPAREVLVLAVAVRLQTAILHEVLKREYQY